MTDDEKNRMRALLEQCGIGYESITVFGTIRCNVHVVCVSRDTAGKWAALLSRIFADSKVTVTETVWNAVKNKGTSMRPTKRKGFLIGVAH